MSSDGGGPKAPIDRLVSTMWQQCEHDRLQKTIEARDEAERWKAEGDWYGWNFHQGKSAGTIEASFIYCRIERALAPAVNEMARLLRKMRTPENAKEVDAALLAAGYSG